MISLDKRKVQFYVSGGGNEVAHLIIPRCFLKDLGITPEERIVSLQIEDNKLIVQKSK